MAPVLNTDQETRNFPIYVRYINEAVMRAYFERVFVGYQENVHW